MPNIHKNVNKNIVQDEYKNYKGWDSAIKAAELLLLRIQVREREVQAVVNLFKTKRRNKEMWPGEEAGTDKSIPA